MQTLPNDSAGKILVIPKDVYFIMGGFNREYIA